MAQKKQDSIKDTKLSTADSIAEKLSAPIVVSWKMQNKVGTDKANMVAYIDSRDVQNRLDSACGVDGWQDRYHTEGGKLFCDIGIKFGDQWVFKSDAGMESKVAADKGAASDAFKRAAVKWGIGRFVYDIDSMFVNIKQYKNKDYPCDDAGKILWSRELISEYCNSKLESNE